jgi:hypothetical protein
MASDESALNDIVLYPVQGMIIENHSNSPEFVNFRSCEYKAEALITRTQCSVKYCHTSCVNISQKQSSDESAVVCCARIQLNRESQTTVFALSYISFLETIVITFFLGSHVFIKYQSCLM